MCVLGGVLAENCFAAGEIESHLATQSLWQLNSEHNSQNVLNNSNCMLENNNLHISLF